MKLLVLLNVVLISCHYAVFVEAFDENPYRWVLSYGKPAVQSSTNGDHVASYATDGDYNRKFAPVNYSQTTVSDSPYLQVDLGAKMAIDYLTFHFPTLTDPPKVYSSIRVSLSDTPTFTTNSRTCFGTYDISKVKITSCNKWARYLTIESRANAVELSIVEIAVHRRPIESIARNKPAIESSTFGSRSTASNTVDMDLRSVTLTNGENKPWIRVDLEELFYVFEVMIWLRPDCCDDMRQNISVRAGRSLSNNGNSNNFCGKHVLYQYEIRSFYCNVIGRYVNVQLLTKGTLSVGEIVVNPETTANVLAHSANSADAPMEGNYAVRFITDGFLHNCHVMIHQAKSKKIWLTMGETYDIYKILIVNNPERLDALVDFRIKVGMAGQSKPSCLKNSDPYNMAGILTKAFYCKPRRTGNEIFILQSSTEKTMSICEVAAFTEARPAIDRSKDHYVWAEENTVLLQLTCDAEAFPTPVLTWVKDNETLQSESSILELTSLRTNDSGEYECWANNTHGVDLKVVHLVVTGNLRVCVDFVEIKFILGKSESEEFRFRGHKWYSFYDPDNGQSLQFSESFFKTSPCEIWLNGKHPKVGDGVVSRKLCSNPECSTTQDVYVRRCTGGYIYNFRDWQKMSSSMPFCLKKAQISRSGMNPAVASPKYGYALWGSVFRTETEVRESYNCLVMCQLSTKCKSFNFSKKNKVCELNSATKKEFPGNYVTRKDFDYFHFGKGVMVTRRGGEL